MTFTRQHVEWLSLILFLAIVAIVFQQISTDLVKQGIAEGDPFHNAAFFPRAVCILIIAAVLIRVVTLTLQLRQETIVGDSVAAKDLRWPFMLVCLFGLYLLFLDLLGYHLATAPFIAIAMIICGDKKPIPTILYSVAVALLIAFLFEKYLKIVLPGGMFAINIPW